MSVDGLDARLLALAQRKGTEAAQSLRRGDRAERCPWPADGASLTAARLAAAWSEAFIRQMGAPKPLPE